MGARTSLKATAVLLAAATAAACMTPSALVLPIALTTLPAASTTPPAASTAPDALSPMLLHRNVASAATRSRPDEKVWAIERGTYAGMKIPVRFAAALGPGRNPEHFWRIPADAGDDAAVVGWNSEHYPIAVAFRHARSSERISGADSAAFWSILHQMGADLGMTLFNPATVGSGSDPVDTIVVDLRFMAATDGLSRTTSTPSGELFDVRVTFRDAGALHDAHVVAHEMMHALGFGHTTAWESVLNPSEGYRQSRLSPEDVAYTEVAMGLRTRREQSDMRRLIRLAVEREPRRLDAVGSFVSDRTEWATVVIDEDPGQNCGRIPADLIAMVPACGKGLR